MSDENPAFLQEKIEYLQLSAFRDIFLREREEKTQSHLTVPLVPAACYLTPLPPITFYSGVSIVTYKCIVTYITATTMPVTVTLGIDLHWGRGRHPDGGLNPITLSTARRREGKASGDRAWVF